MQFVLLASLVWIGSGEPVTQQKLSAHARTDRMMTSQVLRALEAAGLVDRTAHPTDGRARTITITETGRDLANRANVAVEKCDEDFFSALGTRQGRFTRMLGDLIEGS